MFKPTHIYWNRLIAQALKEDVGQGDVTTNLLVSSQSRSRAKIIIKKNAVVCGLKLVRAVFKRLDPKIKVSLKYNDGDRVKLGQVVAVIEGKTRAILTGERLALNLLGYASAMATQTRAFVDAVKPYKTAIMDTRKTTPTLRPLQRYAVACGGGVNHRFDLHEMVMIKDNHRLECAGQETLAETVLRLRRRTKKKIIVEVDTLSELKDVLMARPDVILLDNMRGDRLRRAVGYVQKMVKQRRPLLEASGGVTLRTIKSVAATGVDRISVGALTHSLMSIDVSLEMIGK